MTGAHGLFSTELGASGPRVVFLHGLFGQGKNWTTFAKALSSRAQVMLVDLPNHGRSAWTTELSYPAMAAQVGALLAEQGNGEPYAVVGHSMGGKVAMALALGHPELVERLCVVDVSPAPTAQVDGFDRYVQGMRRIDLTTLPDRAAADTLLVPYVDSSTVRAFLLQNLRRDPVVGWRWQMNLDLLGDHLPEIGSWAMDATAPYPGPVLWLAGARSTYVTPAYAPVMRALFPRVQLVTVKGAGHWVHSDQPEVFLAAMRQFLHLAPDLPGNGVE